MRVFFRRLHRAVIMALASLWWLPDATLGQISGVVSKVSESSYRNYHLMVENMGLGLYGGPAYNYGFRNRDGWAGLGTLGNREARLYLQNTMANLGLNVTTHGIYYNVIGELPGRTNPNRVFIIAAHYDHISGDRPGGDDNASGTAGMLEAARVLSRYRFDSTIRFIGFNAEEDGLLGSKDYVNNLLVPQQQNIVGMVNLDMILRPRWDNGNPIVDLDLSTRTSHAPSVAWANKYRQAAANYVPSLVVDSTIANVNGGSDQDPFVVAGYPAFLASENTAHEIWGGSNVYYHGYHDASDRLANNPNSPSGVTYDFPFATNVVRAAVALLAQEAGLLFELTPCDFNIDGLCNLTDLNQLLGQGPVAPGVPVTPGVNAMFDLTGDSLISNADVDSWLALAATRNGLSEPYRRGDSDLNGIVDGSDFVSWSSNRFSATLLWHQGDFDGDGKADGTDVGYWNANKSPPTEGGQPIPEPSGCWLGFSITCVTMLARKSELRRRRRERHDASIPLRDRMSDPTHLDS